MKKILLLLFIALIACEKENIEKHPEFDPTGTSWIANHSWERIERVGLDGTVRERATWTDSNGTVHQIEDQWKDYRDDDMMVNMTYSGSVSLSFLSSDKLTMSEEWFSESKEFGKSTIKSPYSFSGDYNYKFDKSKSRGSVSIWAFEIAENKLIFVNQAIKDGNYLTFIKKQKQ